MGTAGSVVDFRGEDLKEEAMDHQYNVVMTIPGLHNGRKSQGEEGNSEVAGNSHNLNKAHVAGENTSSLHYLSSCCKVQSRQVGEETEQ